MLKYLILLFNMMSFIIIRTFVNENVTITPSYPAEVKAGSDFVMEITISRNNVEGFAKFQQELPSGFSAKEMESQGASFTLSGKTIKLIWTSLPSETEFKIKYKVMVDQNVSGERSLGGKFSYVVDNVKQTATLPESTIKIVPNGEITSSENNTTTQKPDSIAVVPLPKATPDSAAATNTRSLAAETVSGTRKITPTANPGEFMIEISVKKGNVGGFAKLQENIPTGYSAVPANTGSASFTFTEQKAKFVWLTVPSEESFMVSYIIKADAAIQGEATVDGLLSYIENDETKKAVIAPITFINMGTPVPITTKLTDATVDTNSKKPETATQANTETAAPPVKEETTPVVTNIPSPETNVVYKVQIAALHNPVNASYFKQSNNIKDKVGTEMHEGFTKYTVGSFKEYKPARDHRENIRAKNIQGPFVTAYNTGKRITVQEALMITSQKWYK